MTPAGFHDGGALCRDCHRRVAPGIYPRRRSVCHHETRSTPGFETRRRRPTSGRTSCSFPGSASLGAWSVAASMVPLIASSRGGPSISMSGRGSHVLWRRRDRLPDPDGHHSANPPGRRHAARSLVTVAFLAALALPAFSERVSGGFARSPPAFGPADAAPSFWAEPRADRGAHPDGRNGAGRRRCPWSAVLPERRPVRPSSPSACCCPGSLGGAVVAPKSEVGSSSATVYYTPSIGRVRFRPIPERLRAALRVERGRRGHQWGMSRRPPVTPGT
jgi:hypothetical protein